MPPPSSLSKGFFPLKKLQFSLGRTVDITVTYYIAPFVLSDHQNFNLMLLTLQDQMPYTLALVLLS